MKKQFDRHTAHALLAAVILPLLLLTTASANLAESGLATGVKSLITDVFSFLTLLCPTVGAAAAAYFAIRRSMSDEQDGKMWEKRIKTAILCGVGGCLVSVIITRINGKAKETFVRRTYREAKSVYDAIGQSDRYQRTLELSLACACGGVVIGQFLKNLLLSVVLAVGLYFIPLWFSRFALYRYQRFVSDELGTVLSLITTSYIRSNDILAAVEENLSNIKQPVKAVFVSFCNELKYVDANAPAAIERMKGRLDNKLFWQWCDTLILCQDNHLLQAALPPIVGKFSILKAQQAANETRMMKPLKQALIMAALVAGFCPLMRLINIDWYTSLMYSFVGQVVFGLAVVVVFITLNKGIALSGPIAYDV